jgi:hypothetical protein
LKPTPVRRYLACLTASAACLSAAAWVWVAAMPLAYLDPEYPSWLAKRQMLASCDLGEVLVVGDSRAAVNIVPALLGVKTTNLAVGGGQAIEAFVAVSRALDCPVLPKRVVISLNAGHFAKPDLFWERSVRFGFLNRAELAEVLRTAVAIGDRTVLSPYHRDGLPPQLRAWLYAMRFPSLYFNGVLKAGVFLRLWQNQASLEAALASRGQYYFGTDPGSSVIAADGELRSFVPLPIQDHYFNALLALLAAHGIPADFIAMPLNRSTSAHVLPEVKRGYAAYLARYAARFDNFSVVGTPMPEWPDRFFGDAFAHLNPGGAALYSAGFGACLRARLDGRAPGTECDIGWAPTELAQGQ